MPHVTSLTIIVMIVNAYSTLREPAPLDFEAELHLARSDNDVGLSKHISQMMGVACDRGRREMTPTLYAVMRHLQRTRHHYRMEVDGDEMDRLAVWGWQSNAILMTTDQSFRDPAGRILVHGETGDAEGNATVPYPIDAIERAADSREALSLMGIETPRDLPPVIGIGEVEMRPDDEIGWRTLALFIVAVRAESLASGSPIPPAALKAKSPMAFEAFSPAERTFIETESSDLQAITNFSWRYEALYALQWAVDLYEEMTFANKICDVPQVAQIMVDRPDREIVTSAQLRPTKQILDALDTNMRLLWAARSAANSGREMPAKIDGGVLSERQHALNWLVQQDRAAWDDVDTPT